MFDSYFSESIIKRAKDGKFIEIETHDLRDFTTDNHKTVDDTPYGGGAGMVMKVEPIYKVVEDIKNTNLNNQGRDAINRVSIGGKKTRIILFSAKGNRYTQRDAERLLQYGNLIFLCGRYEGIDERVIENIADEEISIGDFVLTGGEIPTMAVIDSLTRLIPGVLGNIESIETESHSQDGYLEYPQYTKPEEFMGWKVPEVLLSGDHKKVAEWRDEHAKKIKK